METKEYQNEIIRSMFQAKTRSSVIAKQSSISEEFCIHLIKIITNPNNDAVNHWISEITTWLHDTLTGVTMKQSNMYKPYIYLFDHITLSNEDWDSRQINNIIEDLERKYNYKSICNEREVENQISNLIGNIPLKLVLTKSESSDIIKEWYDNLTK